MGTDGKQSHLRDSNSRPTLYEDNLADPLWISKRLISLSFIRRFPLCVKRQTLRFHRVKISQSWTYRGVSWSNVEARYRIKLVVPEIRVAVEVEGFAERTMSIRIVRIVRVQSHCSSFYPILLKVSGRWFFLSFAHSDFGRGQCGQFFNFGPTVRIVQQRFNILVGSQADAFVLSPSLTVEVFPLVL